MKTIDLFEKLFSVISSDCENYIVAGSLSFLPLLDYYRQPGYDIDVAVNRKLFLAKSNQLKSLGEYHILRVNEIAVADKSAISKFISPKTGFIHINIDDGLLDLSQYKENQSGIELIFGMGFTLEITKEIITRKRLLEYEGIRYYAAPIEFMFLTKSVEYVTALKNGNNLEFKKTKHYEDICRMSTIINWPFATILLESIKIKWAGIYLPDFMQKEINPYKILEIDKLRDLMLNGYRTIR